MDAADSNSSVRFTKGSEEVGDESGFDFIVGVDETDIVAGGKIQTGVAGGGLAMIFLVDDFDTKVFFGIVIGNGIGIVSGAVVDKKNFEILMSLSEDRVEAFW